MNEDQTKECAPKKLICKACGRDMPETYDGGACPHCHTIGILFPLTGPNRKQRRAARALARRKRGGK